jgi:predicted DNA-binding transcriptional regulator AlpA
LELQVPQKGKTMNKRYYRAKEAANFLGIGVSTVWLYAKQQKLLPKKLSPKVTVFDIEDLNKLLHESTGGING